MLHGCNKLMHRLSSVDDFYNKEYSDLTNLHILKKFFRVLILHLLERMEHL